MKTKSIFIMVVALFISVPLVAQKAYDAQQKDPLVSEKVQQDISYKEADKELNKVYRQILKKYEKAPAFLKKLKVAQRLWIQFRDAELEMRFPLENKRLNYGTVYFGCKEQFLIDMTIARTKTLKGWLDVDEYDGCNGSKGTFEE